MNSTSSLTDNNFSTGPAFESTLNTDQTGLISRGCINTVDERYPVYLFFLFQNQISLSIFRSLAVRNVCNFELIGTVPEDTLALSGISEGETVNVFPQCTLAQFHNGHKLKSFVIIPRVCVMMQCHKAGTYNDDLASI